MSDHIEMDGEVLESTRGTITVLLEDTEEPIKCHVGGKMKQHKINIIPGDFVKVKISPYDLNRGFIVFRYKNKNNKK